MAGNSQLTVAAHALTWIELHRRIGDGNATSEGIAGSVNTNPVVIRRLLGRMRDAGLVHSRRGAAAGWVLARPLEDITLRDVYEAIEPPPLFAMHRSDPNLGCPVGSGIQPAMRPVYTRIEEAVRTELDQITLADVLRDVLASR
ncbi:transcriptional regulator, BadM/Rrf2 family [Streptomyces sp. 2231.1]|uniref:Rrf2 family transcriptional regulator n=1 Tax=Streptomyces sp. 2231.1 TaxID=1855347 RepID=UPI00089DA363|nr:Rrf2 family transcriptional regulator [Streptomyces sp. 2231.1]SEC10793.1 transcriptional regulator, BadM/Rrf2 family [Streptomyces sp. 2231.1]